MKWLVTSINSDKLLGAQQALYTVFPDDHIELQGQNVTGTPPQPVGYNAGLKYATKRIAALTEEQVDWCDYIISLESFIEVPEAKCIDPYDAVAVVIATRERKVVTRSRFQQPSKYNQQVPHGFFERAVELGWAETDALKCTVGELVHEKFPEFPANNWIRMFGTERKDQIRHAVKKTLRHWQDKQELVRGFCRYPDFPRPGVLFQDMNPLLANPELFSKLVNLFIYDIQPEKVDLILGLESRGFILGAAVALKLGKGFVPARKPGKLPGKTVAASYQKEYGTDTLEVQLDLLPTGSRVLVIDDILATGGTAAAACRLVEQAGATVAGVMVVNDVPALRQQVTVDAVVLLEK